MVIGMVFHGTSATVGGSIAWNLRIEATGNSPAGVGCKQLFCIYLYVVHRVCVCIYTIL